MTWEVSRRYSEFLNLHTQVILNLNNLCALDYKETETSAKISTKEDQQHEGSGYWRAKGYSSQ